MCISSGEARSSCPRCSFLLDMAAFLEMLFNLLLFPVMHTYCVLEG